MGTLRSIACSGRVQPLYLPLIMLFVFSIGVVLTQSEVFRLRQKREDLLQALYAQHSTTTVATTKSIGNSFISQLPAANTGRKVMKSTYSNLGSSAHSFHSVMLAFASSFYFRPLTFALWAVLNETDRPSFEQWLASQCQSTFNVTCMADVSDPIANVRADWRSRAAVLPASPSGLYSVVTDAVSSSGLESTAQNMCNSIGLEISSSPSRVRSFVAALETGLIVFQEPRPSLGIPDGQTNIGVLMPLHADTAEDAGVAGANHALFVQSNPEALAYVRGTLCGAVPCGHSSKALGAISIPLYPSMGLDSLLDLVPLSGSSEIAMIYVPPALHGLIQLPPSVVTRKPELFSIITGRGYTFQESAYMEVTYLEKASSILPAGSLKPLLQALDPVHVLMSVRALPPSPTRGRGQAAWSNIGRTDALKKALEAEDSPLESLQAGCVLTLGTNVYLFVLRNVNGAAPALSTIATETARTWTMGAITSVLVAFSLPFLKYWYDRRREQQHSKKMELIQAERDGVVQAVAFAAHEIRNPMHGVLASLETALADLEPLKNVLHTLEIASPVTLGHSDSKSSAASSDELHLHHALARVLGEEALEATLSALEDVTIAKMSAESCHRLVNDMVDYSKLHKGVMRMQNSDMVLRDALRAALLSQRRLLAITVDTYLRVHKNVPKTVWADQVRVLQVVGNAMTNACKFTFSGSISLSCFLMDTGGIPGMRLAHNPTNQWLTVVVSDTGKGLAGIDVDSLFEPLKESAGRPKATVWQQAVAWWTRASAKRNGAAQPPKQSAASTSQVDQTPTDQRTLESAVSASAVARSRGSGLGLPVARLMARTHGGDCNLYTATLGTAFTPTTNFLFLLPMSALTSTDAGEPAQYPLFGRSGSLTAASRAAVQDLVGQYMSELLADDADMLHIVEEITDGGTGGTKSRTTGRSRHSSFSHPAGEERASPRGGMGELLQTGRSQSQERTSEVSTVKDTAAHSMAARAANGASAPAHPEQERTSVVQLSPPASSSSLASGDLVTPFSSATASAMADREVASEHISVLMSPSLSRPLRVLYAEDDPVNRRLMHRMVNRCIAASASRADIATTASFAAQTPATPSVDLTLACDGWEAICLLYTHGHMDYDSLVRQQRECINSEGELSLPDIRHAEEPFDLILLDIDMPRASGVVVAHCLRLAQSTSRHPLTLQVSRPSDRRPASILRASPSVPILAVTGRSVGFEIGEAWCAAHGVSLGQRPASPPHGSSTSGRGPEKVIIVPSLSDAALATDFDGVLGKPFKQKERTWLLATVKSFTS